MWLTAPTINFPAATPTGVPSEVKSTVTTAVFISSRFHSAVVTCTNKDNSHFLSPLDNQPAYHKFEHVIPPPPPPPPPPPQVLGEAGSLLTTHAKKGEIEAFSQAVDNTANAVCQLTEASAQAAYLVGIADPSSTAATPGLVDQTQFARASQVNKYLIFTNIRCCFIFGLASLYEN